jgi:glyoxylase-like metal-dependent hydrolase (beta-lactamase superfamily II)
LPRSEAPRPATTIPVKRQVAGNPGPYTLEGTNTWIVGRNPSVVIDPGPDDAKHLAAVASAAGPTLAILITHHHSDHEEGAAALAAMLGAPIRAWRRAPGRLRLRDGDELAVGGGTLRAVHTPGHTRDHLCFLGEPGRLLFTGDTVLGRGSTVIEPPDGDLSAYLASLERILALEPRVLHPGHGPTVHDAGARLRAYLDHRRERERQVLGLLDDGPASAAALALRIYPRLPAGLGEGATRTTYAHLLKLEHDGVLDRTGRGIRGVFSRSPANKEAAR